jgi:hypothetical protein
MRKWCPDFGVGVSISVPIHDVFVHRLKFMCDAYHVAWREVFKFVPKFSNVSSEFEICVQDD